MQPELTVAITGFGGIESPEAGTTVARALRRDWPGPLRLLGLTYQGWCNGAWIDGSVDEIHRFASYGLGKKALLDRLLAIHEVSPFDVLLPCLDNEIPVITQMDRELAAVGIRTLLPPLESLLASQKPQLARFCAENKIATPHTVFVYNPDDVPHIADQMGYPVMIKGSLTEAVRVWNAGQAHSEAWTLYTKWGQGILVQAALDGDEYGTAMVAGADGRCRTSLSTRKLGVSSRGKNIVGATVEDPELDRESRRILEALDWRGPLELEFLRFRDSGRFTLLEINHRLPAWTMLSAYAGANLAVSTLNAILEKAPAAPPVSAEPRAGTMFVRDVMDSLIQRDSLERLNRHGRLVVPQSSGRRANKKPPSSPALRDSGAVVAVTGPTAFEVVQSGLGVARSLRQVPELGRLIALATSAYDTGLYRPELFDGAFRLHPEDKGERLLDALQRARKTLGLDVLIPCRDWDVEDIVPLAEDLRSIGIQTLLPTPEALEAHQKRSLPFLDLEGVAFQIPETMTVQSVDEIRAAGERFGFPFVLKAPIVGSTLLHSPEQAEGEYRVWQRYGTPVALAQRFVGGDEFAMAAVFDGDSRMVSAFPIKKLHRCRQNNTWGAGIVDLPEIVRGLQEVGRRIGWRGPLEAEFIREYNNETFHMFEINSRFPSWIHYSTLAGCNLPYDVLLTILGKPPGEKSLDRHGLFVQHPEDIPADPGKLALFSTRGWFRHDA